MHFFDERERKSEKCKSDGVNQSKIAQNYPKIIMMDSINPKKDDGLGR